MPDVNPKRPLEASQKPWLIHQLRVSPELLNFPFHPNRSARKAAQICKFRCWASKPCHLRERHTEHGDSPFLVKYPHVLL